MKKLINIPIVLILIILVSCSENNDGLPYYNTPDFTPEWFSEQEAEKKNIHTIGNFNFKDQDGKLFTNKTLKGKIYIANFFFTVCPTICPRMTSNLIKLQESFKDENDVKLVSYSVMPWVDSVPVLKAYEKKFNLKNGMWYLATGSKSEIYELARKSFFAEKEPGYNKDSTEFLHTEHILLVDKNGHLRGVYNGTLQLEVDRIIDDVRILKSQNNF